MNVDASPDLGEHVDLLAGHYQLSSGAAAALATLAAMVVDRGEDVLPRRPATNRLVAIRLSSCAAAVELEQVRSARRIVDIGSGLGFPGLVLAPMLPEASVALVEENAARCEFLRHAAAAMGLTNVEVVHQEAQRWTDGAASADLVTVRGLSSPSNMVRLAAPLLVVGGTAVIFGRPRRDLAKEADAQGVGEAAGLRPVTVHRLRPIGLGPRYVYVFEKVAATPSRRSLKPEKANRRSGRQAQNQARAVGVVEVQRKAVERLERAARRVRELEALEAEHPGTTVELEHARAVVQKVERRLEVLAERVARAERRLNPAEIDRSA